jgi:elongation factor 3
MTHKGKVPIVDDALFDKLERQGRLSGANTPRSKAQTPAGSAAVTPAGSGDEASRVASGTGTPENAAVSLIKKKKLTRNQMKAQAERRKARQLHWLR